MDYHVAIEDNEFITHHKDDEGAMSGRKATNPEIEFWKEIMKLRNEVKALKSQLDFIHQP